MIVAAVVNLTTQGGAESDRLGVEGITAVVGWVAALIMAGVAVAQVRQANRARVSSDAQKAREQEEAARAGKRADTEAALTHRDEWIATLTEERDKARAERDRAIEQRDETRDECDGVRDEFRLYKQAVDAALMGHVPWDVLAHGIAIEAGKPIGLPPPLRPPPKEV